MSFAALPQELQHLVIGRLAHDGSGEALKGLASLRWTTRALQQMVDEYPDISIEMRGAWLPKQLAAACASLTQLTSLSVAADVDGAHVCPMSRSQAFTAGELRAIFGGPASRLRRLDLRFLGGRYSQRWTAGGRKGFEGELPSWLPLGLEDLRFPPWSLPIPVIQDAFQLTRLTRLDLLGTGRFPTSPITSLLHLAAGERPWGERAAGRDFFTTEVLPQLTRLTALNLEVLNRPLEQIAASPSIVDLALRGFLSETCLEGLIASLPSLQSLAIDSSVLHGAPDLEGDCSLATAATSLRVVDVQHNGVALATMPTGLTSLRLMSKLDGKDLLEEGLITCIRRLSALQRLELVAWDRWDDVGSLAELPLRELVLQGKRMYRLLRKLLLTAAGLPLLKCLTLNCLALPAGSAPRLSGLLLGLPVFERLACSERVAERCTEERSLGGFRDTGLARVTVTDLEGGVSSIVAVSPEQWRLRVSQGHSRVFTRLKAAK